ncbi:MAG: AMP-binding protein [Chloroflexi bacterium]|jgi:acyl-CoA synthetase (AMP-forming)/AMP-acid ligase II|nr:AMP-binding protein [Chloroflexota bacterium]
MTVTNKSASIKHQVRSAHDWVFQDAGNGINVAKIIDGSTGAQTSGTEIIENSRRVASALLSRKVGSEAVVAVALPNLPVVAEIALGVFSSGCTLAMLNSNNPSEVLAQQLTEVDAKILITTSGIPSSILAGKQYETILVDSGHDSTSYADFTSGPAATELPEINPNSVAVILQSSGTTSPSKPIELTHKNVIAGLETVDDRIDLNSSDSSLAIAPFFHALGFYMMLFAPLRRGMPVVTMDVIDMEKAIDLIDEYEISYMAGGPPMMAPIARAGASGRLKSLKKILFAGAAIDHRTEAAIRETFPHATTGQGYALTEFVLISWVAPDDGHPLGSVGRIMRGVEMKIIDPDDGHMCAAGEEGEIVVKGPQMTRGYRNRPDATAALIDSDGWLLTGDLGKVDDEGFLFITGRLKEMILVEGQRIAPKTFEELIRKIDAVQEVVVSATREYPNSHTPIAFVVGDGSVTTGQIRSALESRPDLPNCEVVFVDSIPKSPAGKILRVELLKTVDGIFSD